MEIPWGILEALRGIPGGSFGAFSGGSQAAQGDPTGDPDMGDPLRDLLGNSLGDSLGNPPENLGGTLGGNPWGYPASSPVGFPGGSLGDLLGGPRVHLNKSRHYKFRGKKVAPQAFSQQPRG